MTERTVVYIHGFGSTGESSKVDRLRELLPKECNVLNPTLPFEPLEVVRMLSDIVGNLYRVNSDMKVVFLGTSLGGFYARYAAAYFGTPAIMVNPSVFPDESLVRKLGINTNYATGEEFLVTLCHLDQLRDIRRMISTSRESVLEHVFCAMDDDVIDYRLVDESFPYVSSKVIMEDGGHRFEKHWDMVIDKVREVLYTD